jgi:glycosyltransferase involved in cell wall biosynthesis
MGAHLLSVVIPTHDRAERVLEAAASVLSQDGELEVIVVDDGSTDGTPEALDALRQRDPRVRVVRNEEPLGPCEARNRAIAVARGDLLATCDDDDVWLPGAAATMVAYLDDHPDVAAASAWHEVAHGRRTVAFRGPLEYDDRALLWSNVVAVPFIVIRRRAFAADPWYDPGIAGGEDWELCLRCALERPMRTVPSVLYRYRQHGGTRVTTLAERHRQVRAALVAKHGDRMSPGCVAYHRTVMALLVGTRRQAAGELASAAGHHPLSTARGAAMLLGGQLTSRVGVRRGDPGLAARFAARLAATGVGPTLSTSGGAS